MILLLRILFVGILGSMLWVTSWASLQQALFSVPREVYSNPWFIATLVDAYWAFITFYVWLAWKEESIAARILWIFAVLALGNIAMSAFMLGELFRVKLGDPLAAVFARPRAGSGILPGVLCAVSVVVYLIA